MCPMQTQVIVDLMASLSHVMLMMLLLFCHWSLVATICMFCLLLRENCSDRDLLIDALPQELRQACPGRKMGKSA